MSRPKSQVFIGKGTQNRSLQISAVLGIPTGQAHFTYLGVPIFRGKPRRIHLQGLADRAKAKMAGWVGKLISMAGRVRWYSLFFSLFFFTVSWFISGQLLLFGN